jgi:hypothetical protein
MIIFFYYCGPCIIHARFLAIIPNLSSSLLGRGREERRRREGRRVENNVDVDNDLDLKLINLALTTTLSSSPFTPRLLP